MAVVVCRSVSTLVDDEDVALVESESWRLDRKGYLRRNVSGSGAKRAEALHRVIVNAPRGVQVDHINGDKLDNRRANLRLGSNAENNRNILSRGGASEFRGVTWSHRERRWIARVKYNGRNKHLGSFRSEIDAAKAYDEGARAAFGSWGRFNFPREGERSALKK